MELADIFEFGAKEKISAYSFKEGTRVEYTVKVGNFYTRNEWRKWENTLETSGEDVKIHSKRVGKM